MRHVPQTLGVRRGHDWRERRSTWPVERRRESPVGFYATPPGGSRETGRPVRFWGGRDFWRDVRDGFLSAGFRGDCGFVNDRPWSQHETRHLVGGCPESGVRQAL